MTEKITVYRSNPRRACLDPERQRLINGTEDDPETVPNTSFVQQAIKSGVLITARPKKQDSISVDDFTALSAAEQKELLQKLEITGDDSNEDKRVALYTAYLESKSV